MKQFAIIGLSYFGKNILDELLALDVEILIIDKDRAVIDEYKDAPVDAVALDVLNEENLKRVLPPSVDAVVIDLGEKIEASILATSYCHKLGIKRILAKAETEAHGEILELVGATKVVFPNREAAKRMAPLMLSSALFSYLPVSGSLVIAEVGLPEGLIGKTPAEAELRKGYGLNVISVKNGEDEEYGAFSPDYRFRAGDIALVSGSGASLDAFIAAKTKRGDKTIGTLRRLFGIGRK